MLGWSLNSSQPVRGHQRRDQADPTKDFSGSSDAYPFSAPGRQHAVEALLLQLSFMARMLPAIHSSVSSS